MLAVEKIGFSLVHESSLRTMTADGLKDRIGSSAAGLIMRAGLLALVPLQGALPSDILLQVYKKDGKEIGR